MTTPTDDEILATRELDRAVEAGIGALQMFGLLLIAAQVGARLAVNPWMGPELWIAVLLGAAIIVPLASYRLVHALRATRYVLNSKALIVESGRKSHTLLALSDLRQIDITEGPLGSQRLLMSTRTGELYRVGPVADVDSFAAQIESAAHVAGATISLVHTRYLENGS